MNQQIPNDLEGNRADDPADGVLGHLLSIDLSLWVPKILSWSLT